MSDQVLSSIRVLDLTHHVSGPYCTRLLADFGAQVLKVERPGGGDPSRKAGPFPGDIPDQEASGLFLYLNTNKKSVTLDLKTVAGLKIFRQLAEQADILVENFRPRVLPALGLGYEALKAVNPGLIMTSITSFGQNGPYRDYKAAEIVVQALGGWLLGRGEPEREPVRAGGWLRLGEYLGGMYAATGTMTGITHKMRTGAGQHIDVSLMEAAHLMLSYPVAMRNFPHSTINPQQRYTFVPGAEECKDGNIGINTLTGAHWRDLCLMMGMDDWAENRDYNNLRGRFPRRHEIRSRMNKWLAQRSGEEILNEGQDWRVPVAPIYTTEQMLKSPQYLSRDYFVSVEHPGAGTIDHAGAPFKMGVTPWKIKTAAPALGQHNEEVYCGLLGYGKEDLVRLRQAGVI